MERIRYNFWINERQRDGLRLVKERDGITESEQIRRAIDGWLTGRGVPAFTETAQWLEAIDRLEAKHGTKAKGAATRRTKSRPAAARRRKAR